MEPNETKATAAVEHAPVVEAKTAYTLRETAEALDRSDIWIRRQFSKKIGVLGAAAYKNDDGNWRVGVEAVTAEKARLAAKDDLRVARAKGEVPKQTQVYTPDRVKAPGIVRTMITAAPNGLTQEQVDLFALVLEDLGKMEMAAWQARQEKRAAKDAEA